MRDRDMKPTRKDLGYKVGDLFVYTNDRYFQRGTILVLSIDDGSASPAFKALYPSKETLGLWTRDNGFDPYDEIYMMLHEAVPLADHISNLLDILEEHNATNPNIP